jgi:hypothetical protein
LISNIAKDLSSVICDTISKNDVGSSHIPIPGIWRHIIMRGGGDNLLGRWFTVTDITPIKRKAIRGTQKGTLKFAKGEKCPFITGERGAQKTLRKGNQYKFNRGMWDSTPIQSRVIRLTDWRQ